MNVTVHHEIPVESVLIILVAGFGLVVVTKLIDMLLKAVERWWSDRRNGAYADEVLFRVGAAPYRPRDHSGGNNGIGSTPDFMVQRGP